MHTLRPAIHRLLTLLSLTVMCLASLGGVQPALAQTNPWTVDETIPNLNNGNSHVLWIKKGTTDTAGNYSGDTVSIWTVDVTGHQMAVSPTYGPYPGWRAPQLTPAFDGTLRMVWTKQNGIAGVSEDSIVSLWTLDGNANRMSVSPTYGPYPGWQFVENFANPDGTSAVYWGKYTSGSGAALTGNAISIWTVDSVGSRLTISPTYGPYSGWYFHGGIPSFNKDGTSFLAWVNPGTTDTNNNYTGDQLSLWKTDSRGNETSISPTYGRYPGWSFSQFYPAYDGTARLLWTQLGTTNNAGVYSGDTASVWSVDKFGTQTVVSPTYGPYSGWTVSSITATPSSTSRLLWVLPGTTGSSGTFSGDQVSIWSLNAADVETSISPTYTAPGGTLYGMDARPDGSEDLFWRFKSDANSNSTQFSLWALDASNNRTATGPVYGPYF